MLLLPVKNVLHSWLCYCTDIVNMYLSVSVVLVLAFFSLLQQSVVDSVQPNIMR
jgi:hypothetical protein